MNILWKMSSLCLEHCNQFVVWAYVVKSVIDTLSDIIYQQHLKGDFDVIIIMMQLLGSGGYCYFFDYLRIAYYLEMNRHNRFPPHFISFIDNFVDDTDAQEMT